MIFYNLIVAPIEMIVDWVFVFFTTHFTSLGVIGAVCGVSLAINFLALPLYNIADSLQARERKAAKEMEPRIKRIRMAFKGDERFMMLSAYYRECNYNPIYTFRSSLSILIEIPFFIAAYHYLSHAQALKGVSFWILKDLGSADSFFSIGNFQINVLPVLMTAINLVSGAIYSKDTTLRERVQIFVLAAIFLAILYNSPSGLVIYWILNNLFSLAKNIALKMKNPKRIVHAAVSVIFLLISAKYIYMKGFALKPLLALAFSLLVCFFSIIKNTVFLLLYKIKFFKISKTQEKSTEKNAGGSKLRSKTQAAFFIFSAAALAILCGFYLPSSAIATSPIEFSFLEQNFDSPLLYIKSTAFVFLGFFLVWPAAIYFMFGEKVKKWESAIFFTAFLVSVADVFIFNANYGTVDVLFQLEDKLVLLPSAAQKIAPVLLALSLLILSFVLLKSKKIKIANAVIAAVCIAESFLGALNISSINKKFVAYSKSKNQSAENDFSKEISPVYHLSKKEKNVVVIFLDRAINSFLPYALEDLPLLKEQLRGFVYYPNTLSFCNNTDTAFPAMIAGYEYTPENLNARSNETLREKHNEASLVLPELFASADFETTITDPPFPNYTWKGDLSAFSGKKNIRAMELFGKYSKNFKIETNFYEKNSTGLAKKVSKQIREFSILQILLPPLRTFFYNNFLIFAKTSDIYPDIISSLYFLPKLTDFSAQKNQFIFIGNDTCHTPTFLDENFLLPEKENFHGAYKTSSAETAAHYQTFVAAFKQIGKWLDFLKENEVYDNTRIVIVADHGHKEAVNEFLNFKNPGIPASYNPILLFKDFESNLEFSTSAEFMTNADTLFLAKKDLNLMEKNPFTHKKFVQEKENGITVYPVYALEWNAEKMIHKTAFTLDKKKAFHVKENIFDEKNWIPLLDWEKSQTPGNLKEKEALK